MPVVEPVAGVATGPRLSAALVHTLDADLLAVPPPAEPTDTADSEGTDNTRDSREPECRSGVLPPPSLSPDPAPGLASTMPADMMCAAPAAAVVPSAQDDRPDIHRGEQERDDAAEGKLNPVEDVLPAANSLTCIIQCMSHVIQGYE